MGLAAGRSSEGWLLEMLPEGTSVGPLQKGLSLLPASWVHKPTTSAATSHSQQVSTLNTVQVDGTGTLAW